MAIGARKNLPYLFKCECKSDVAPNDFVYMDIDGTVGKAISSDPDKMPAIGYVTKRIGDTAYITRLVVEKDVAGVSPKLEYFISNVHEGKLMDTLPTNTQYVMQLAALGLDSGKLLININDETILRG